MNFQKVLKNQMIQAGIRLFLLLFISLFSTNSSLQAATVIKNLRVEYLKNPVGIDVQNPQFSWVIVSDEVGKKQSVFEITVSNENGTVIWSSGKVHSDKSVGIKYDGAPLSPSTRYMWKVDVWDENNAPISSAENAYFETGLLSSGWSDAKWLKLKKNTNDNALVNFTLACEITVINQNAGVIFGAKDVNNMYMWAINTYNTGSDFPVLRRHIFTNGNITFTDVSLQDKFTKEQIIGVERRLRIEVIENVTKTYLDNTLIDTYPIPELKNFYLFMAYSGKSMAYLQKEDYEKSLSEFYKLTEITDYLKDDGSMALYSYSYTNLNKEKPKKAQEFYNKLKKSGYELYLLDDETLNEIKDGFDLIYKINN